MKVLIALTALVALCGAAIMPPSSLNDSSLAGINATTVSSVFGISPAKTTLSSLNVTTLDSVKGLDSGIDAKNSTAVPPAVIDNIMQNKTALAELKLPPNATRDQVQKACGAGCINVNAGRQGVVIM